MLKKIIIVSLGIMSSGFISSLHASNQSTFPILQDVNGCTHTFAAQNGYIFDTITSCPEGSSYKNKVKTTEKLYCADFVDKYGIENFPLNANITCQTKVTEIKVK